MADRRDTPFVWATWLPAFIVGDVTCEWSLWHMANFHYAKIAGDDMSEWKRRHSQLLRELRDERRQLGVRVQVEGENRFKRRMPDTGLELVGVPDLVAFGDDRIVVIDAKTGQHRDRDVAQVKLYMSCLPGFHARYRDRPMHGEVAYASGHRVLIEPEDVTDFHRSTRVWLEVAQADTPPPRVPSFNNCRFCKIAPSDCSDRVATDVQAVDFDDF